jgi:GNAT superfamily N-acetyltransferase
MTSHDTFPISNMAPTAPAVRELRTDDTHLAHRAMSALRTSFKDERRFTTYVDEVLRPLGYRLIGTFIPDSEQALAVAGFRVAHNLAWDRYLYVDDLSTSLDARRKGHAGLLLDWLVDEGRRLGCTQIHLDSNTGPERFDAHRLYYNHKFAIYSHHFARAL